MNRTFISKPLLPLLLLLPYSPLLPQPQCSPQPQSSHSYLKFTPRAPNWAHHHPPPPSRPQVASSSAVAEGSGYNNLVSERHDPRDRRDHQFPANKATRHPIRRQRAIGSNKQSYKQLIGNLGATSNLTNSL